MHIYLSCISLFTGTIVIQLSFKPIKINFNDLPLPSDPDLNVLKYYIATSFQIYDFGFSYTLLLVN
jgi:hypothetical protein